MRFFSRDKALTCGRKAAKTVMSCTTAPMSGTTSDKSSIRRAMPCARPAWRRSSAPNRQRRISNPSRRLISPAKMSSAALKIWCASSNT
ncbi:MAG TPA: hypothetical protein DCX19_04205 [Alphaproteobacteria bacterium]|nr:hypothetical protein [Alphaproteobacteria bacterium]